MLEQGIEIHFCFKAFDEQLTNNDIFQVKKELPCLSNVVLIGDRRKFLSCLVTIRVEVRVKWF